MQRVFAGVYVMGSEPPCVFERAAALLVVTNGVARGTFAAALHGLDSIELQMPYVAARSALHGAHRVDIAAGAVELVRGYRCMNGLHTLIDLARYVDDITWEQALESALRKKLFDIGDLESLPYSKATHMRRIRRVLKLRPPAAPPTESLLETLTVQLMREDVSLPVPERQVEVLDRNNNFVARVDLAFPEQQVFFELDGQQHAGQPVYDANRQTRVVAATGWHVGRYTWSEITRLRSTTRRSIADLIALNDVK